MVATFLTTLLVERLFLIIYSLPKPSGSNDAQFERLEIIESKRFANFSEDWTEALLWYSSLKKNGYLQQDPDMSLA